jgi:outer membrane protein assembly factor BamB
MRKILVALFLSFNLAFFCSHAGGAGLDTSAWPCKGHDVRHTSRSSYLGAQTNDLKWDYCSCPCNGIKSYEESVSVASVSVAVDLNALKVPPAPCPFSSPTIGCNGTIYIGNGDHGVYAIRTDGTLRWKFLTGGDVESSPAVASDGTVYVGSGDGYVYALNGYTNNINGELKWQYYTGNNWIVSSPVIGSDGTIYIGSEDADVQNGSAGSGVIALNPAGTLKWNFQTGVCGSVSSPAIGSDGTIYIGSQNSSIYAIYPNGTLKWSYPTGGSIGSSPSIGSDGTIYVGSDDSYVYALYPDGSLKWRYKTIKWGVKSSPAIGSDNTIYVGGMNGYVYALNGLTTNPAGELKWQYFTGGTYTDGRISSSPAIGSDGTVYIGNGDGKFYAFDSNGNLKWSYQAPPGAYGTPSTISSPAIAYDGKVYIGSTNGHVYAFKSPNAWWLLPYACMQKLSLDTLYSSTLKIGEYTEDESGTIDIAESQGVTGSEIEIPVRIQNAPNTVSSFGFNVIYDSTILEYTGLKKAELTGDFSTGAKVVSQGELLVGGYYTGPEIFGIPQGASGDVVLLKFMVKGGTDGSCYLLAMGNLTDDIKQFTSSDGYFCIKDMTPPEITCVGDMVIETENSYGISFDDNAVQSFLMGVTAIDNEDGTVKVTNNAPAILPPGITEVTFTACDTAGNTSSCTATITVELSVCMEDESGKLDIPGTTGKIGQEVTIPVRVQNTPNEIDTLGFKVTYNPSVLEYAGFERGDLTPDSTFSQIGVNTAGPNKLAVGGFSYDQSIPQGASGDLILLKFMVNVNAGIEGHCYSLTIENLVDDLSLFSKTPGCFCINSCNGDQNEDGLISPQDALLVFKCYLGVVDCPDCADVNEDGQVTPQDALCIFKKYLELPSCLD